jgi:trehalose/maltose hydrolase-like predicted phosphorylase
MLIFDWDGTAVASRHSPVAHLVWRTEALLGRGLWLAAVTGTNFDNLNRQFFCCLHPKIKGNLLACVNRGSEIYGFDSSGDPVRVWRREAEEAEEAMMDEAVSMAKHILEEQHGLVTRIISNRLNRRKLDIMPFPEWEDPPKEKIGELLEATEKRLKATGVDRIGSVVELVQRCSEEVGLDGRVTSDVKHVELGLTDKADSVAYLVEQVAKPSGIAVSEMLFIGDEFGFIGGCEGSDSKMISEKTKGASFVSVGQEPEGVPPNVYHMGGGIDSFTKILDGQMKAWRDNEQTMQNRKRLTDTRMLLVPADDNWTAVESSCNAKTAASYETLFTLTNGYLSVRGAHEDKLFTGKPGAFVAGVFNKGEGAYDVTELVVIQDPLPIEIRIDGEKIGEEGLSDYRRKLDMQKGILSRAYRWSAEDGRRVMVQSTRFVSAVDEHLLCMKLSVTMERGSGQVALRSRLDGNVSNSGTVHLRIDSTQALSDGGAEISATCRESGTVIAMACKEQASRMKDVKDIEEETGRTPTGVRFLPVDRVDAIPYNAKYAVGHDFEATLEEGESIVIYKFVTVHTSRDKARHAQEGALDPRKPAAKARMNAMNVASVGYAKCKSEHVEKWRKLWEDWDIRIEGPDLDQMAVRFALYHLASLGPNSDDTVSIAAKGLHGEGYKGHVFWDTEIFILPFYIACFPEVARRLLMYRYHTLPGARRKARENGYRGAMYAWESASSGDETTPTRSAPHLETGESVRIWCGELEDHITADVAYAVWNYYKWTGDLDFMRSYGMEIIIEAARFWASRARWNKGKGRYDILRVIGPDEFHEFINNNAFTNYMARQTILTGLKLAEEFPEDWNRLILRLGIDREELAEMKRVASFLYLPEPDHDSGVIEQFEGFYDCDDVNLAGLKDSLKGSGKSIEEALGGDALAQSKLIKQADVIMLGRLLPDLYDKEIWRTNWRYYEPLTTHLSTLSASIHSVFASYLGLAEDAYRYFQQCISTKLKNEKGNLSDGIHAANLGGMWQAVVFGFGGIRLPDSQVHRQTTDCSGACSENIGCPEDIPVISIEPRLPRSWDRLEFGLQCRGRHLQAVITPYRVIVTHKPEDYVRGNNATGEDNVVGKYCFGNDYSGNKSAADDDTVGNINAGGLGTQQVVIECVGRRKCIAKGQNAEFILK